MTITFEAHRSKGLPSNLRVHKPLIECSNFRFNSIGEKLLRDNSTKNMKNTMPIPEAQDHLEVKITQNPMNPTP